MITAKEVREISSREFQLKKELNESLERAAMQIVEHAEAGMTHCNVDLPLRHTAELKNKFIEAFKTNDFTVNEFEYNKDQVEISW